ETDRARLVVLLHRDRDARELPAGVQEQGGGAVLPRYQEAVRVEGDHAAVFEGHLAEGRQVAFGPVRVLAGDDELLHGPRPDQVDGGGLDDQRLRLPHDRGFLAVLGGKGGQGRGGGDQGQGEGQKVGVA